MHSHEIYTAGEQQKPSSCSQCGQGESDRNEQSRVYALLQGLTNYSSQVKSDPLPDCVNNMLLGHSVIC